MLVTPHVPMQVNQPPTQQNFCATLIIPGFFSFYKGISPVMGLCAGLRLCRVISCTAFLFAPQETPTGAGNAPPPRAALSGETRHTN